MNMLVNPHQLAPVGGGPPDPYFASVKLLIGADISVVDESSVGRTVTTIPPAFRNTSSRKFGAGSLDANATGSFTCAQSADFAFGSGDFTVEMWVNTTTTTDQLIRYGGSAAQRCWIIHCETSKLRAGYATTTGGSFTFLSGAITINDGAWHHCVFERSGTTMRTYVDGVMDQKATGFASSLSTPTDLLYIGDLLAPGQIDELRITKGVARYASDAGFTPPTAAFPRA